MSRVSRGQVFSISLLWLAVVMSAVMVVYVTFDVRRHTQELAALNQVAQQLQTESGQLLLEQSALAAYGRVEKIATQELGMRVPEGYEVVVVSAP